MPRIKVRFLSYLSNLAGTREIVLKVSEPANLKGVISKAAAAAGGKLKGHLTDPKTGDLRAPLPVAFVNDKAIAGPYDLVTLKEGDIVSLTVPTAGG